MLSRAQLARQIAISIHALREEGDRGREWGDSPNKRISTHALREEGDPADSSLPG